MLERIAPALGVAQLVAGHEVGAQLAGVVALEVAEFAAHQHAALAHHRGVESGVPVWCDVPVIRRGHLDAVEVVQPEGRGQQPGLALLRKGEAQRRNRQDRHVHEAQHRAFGVADLFFVVDADAGGAQDPVRHPARPGPALAGGVGRVADDRPLLVDEVDPVGLAVSIVAQKPVTRLVEEALERFDLEFELGALEDIARRG